MYDTSLQHRKERMQITFIDRQGNAVVHTPVLVEQQDHRFLFACGGFEAKEIVEARDEAAKAFYEKRYILWRRLFNTATLPFYWSQYEPAEGDTIAPVLEQMARYFKGHSVKVKGHPLAWHTLCPSWLLEKSNEQALALLVGRIEREMSRFKGLVGMWDVINEPVIMPNFAKGDNALTRLCNHYGRVELAKILFQTARDVDPEAQLLINDFDTTDAYARLIAELLDAGTPIDAIGIQSHQHQGYWGDEKLDQVLERFSRFALPLHFSENTFVSGDLMPPHIVDLNDHHTDVWPTTEEGERRQARDIECFYTRLFSHPQVEAITTWEFGDNAWLNAPAGLVRVDNAAKPSYHTLDELVNNRWKTVMTLITDERGRVELEGFKGSYTATVEGKRYPVDGVDSTVVVGMP